MTQGDQGGDYCGNNERRGEGKGDGFSRMRSNKEEQDASQSQQKLGDHGKMSPDKSCCKLLEGRDGGEIGILSDNNQCIIPERVELGRFLSPFPLLAGQKKVLLGDRFRIYCGGGIRALRD